MIFDGFFPIWHVLLSGSDAAKENRVTKQQASAEMLKQDEYFFIPPNWTQQQIPLLKKYF